MVWTTCLLAVSLLLMASVNGRAQAVRETVETSQPSLELDLVWIDVTASLPRAQRPVAERVNRIFERASVSLRWSVGKPQQDIEAGRIAVILLPAPSRSAVLPPQTMGTVMENAPRRSVQVFYQPVLRTLGLDPSLRDSSLCLLSPKEQALFWEALARVIAHEIVHVLIPGGHHDAKGLMSPQLTREMLTSRKYGLEEMTACRVREALGEPASCRLLQSETVIERNDRY